MSDALRTDLSRVLEPATDEEREAKIERLLLNGLDHYFSAEYEQAIDVWSRAFFLDRSHPRARAYIERARSALAERQRESDELLQHSVAAFERGDGGEARRLLRAAMARGAPSDEALAVLDRLNRLEQSSPRSPVLAPPDRTEGDPPTSVLGSGPVPTRVGWAITVAGVVVVALVGMAELRWSWMLGPASGTPTATPVPSPSAAGLPLPRRGETALTRARDLMSSGRLRDALRELELVRPTDPQRQTADRLRADIQKQLIAVAAGTSSLPQSQPALP